MGNPIGKIEMICSCCEGDFDPETEGGCEGELGILPVAFCPTCYSGLDCFFSSIAEQAMIGKLEDFVADLKENGSHG